MSNLFAKAIQNISKEDSIKSSSNLFTKAYQEAQKPKITLVEFKENPKKFNSMEFQTFKKNRQKTNPMPKGRPKNPKYISHKKAYEDYIRQEYQTYLKHL